VLVLSGSQIGMMVDLLEADTPLYGRFTAQLPPAPLPFAALADFFPGYAADEPVATYAVVGGVSGYLERFHPALSLSENIRHLHLFQRTSMFRSEPTLLIGDLVRETRTMRRPFLRLLPATTRRPTWRAGPGSALRMLRLT
jgi:hypothetical protein